jgi:hypothetical protein
MAPDAPAFLLAIEDSSVGAAIRQSLWIYPAANVAHILALTLFAAAVAVMDLRLLGAFWATTPASVVRPARKAAIAALLAMLATGLVLFTAEASHVASNPVFRIKAALIALGILNAALVAKPLSIALDVTPPDQPLPARIRVSAALSLTIWLSVAACGRLIAYF